MFKMYLISSSHRSSSDSAVLPMHPLSGVNVYAKYKIQNTKAQLAPDLVACGGLMNDVSNSQSLVYSTVGQSNIDGFSGPGEDSRVQTKHEPCAETFMLLSRLNKPVFRHLWPGVRDEQGEKPKTLSAPFEHESKKQ